MKQVLAEVVENKQILKELERSIHIKRPRPRDVLGSLIIWLKCPEIAQEARPGQFVMVRCGKGTTLPRPFSIHQINNRGDIALFYAVWERGKGTGWLSKRQRGDTIDLLGPLGNSFSIHPTSHNLLLVAGGTGVAPLVFLARQAIYKGLSVKLLMGASGEVKSSGKQNPSQLYPKELLPSEIEIATINSSPDGERGMVTELIPEFASWADQIFACGPQAMYRTIAQKRKDLGLGGKPVHISLETRMGCGRGICYACTIKTRGGLKKVCQDGPVFNLDDIIWDEFI